VVDGAELTGPLDGRLLPRGAALGLVLACILAAAGAGAQDAQLPGQGGAGGGKAPAPTGRRLALLVGVGKYDRGEPGGFHDLNTAEDVKALQAALIDKFQFRKRDILVLTSAEQTTKARILQAFKSHLIEQASEGDIILFHFSGHGDQVLDDDGDELDGLDEAFVPSDYTSASDGSNYIRDDELADLLAALKAKRPANITVFLDTCHSGTATRDNPLTGRFVVRGRGWRGPPPVVRRGEERPTGDSLRERGRAEGYTVISAARPDQSAREGTVVEGLRMGVFTYHLVKALEAASSSTTYRDLFERLNYSMTRSCRDQNPQLEGQIDQPIMGGAAVAQAPYVAVQEVQAGFATLAAGMLHGVTKGSRYALYKAGTHDFSSAENRLAEAEIVTVHSTESRAKLLLEGAPGVTEEALVAARAVEVQHNYGDFRLSVALADAFSQPELASVVAPVAELLGRMEVVTLHRGQAVGYDILIKPADAEGKQCLIERASGSVVETVAMSIPAAALGRIRAAIEGEARWQMLRDLESLPGDQSMGIELRVVKVAVEDDGFGHAKYAHDIEVQEPGRPWVVKPGDYVMLELRNTGQADCYVTVLDLRSDGLVGPLWPYPGITVDNKTKADREWHRIREPFIFRIREPYGTEIYKAIATLEPTDFSPLLDDRTAREGARPPGADSPLGRLLRQAVSNTRGTELAGSISPQSWATTAVMFEIGR